MSFIQIFCFVIANNTNDCFVPEAENPFMISYHTKYIKFKTKTST